MPGKSAKKTGAKSAKPNKEIAQETQENDLLEPLKSSTFGQRFAERTNSGFLGLFFKGHSDVKESPTVVKAPKFGGKGKPALVTKKPTNESRWLSWPWALLALVTVLCAYMSSTYEPSARLHEGQSHYQTLQISESASTEEIKEAFRKLTLEYHPDKNQDCPDCADKFSAVQAAYTELSTNRKKYDSYASINKPFSFGTGSVGLTAQTYHQLVMRGSYKWVIYVYDIKSRECESFNSAWDGQAFGDTRVKYGQLSESEARKLSLPFRVKRTPLIFTDSREGPADIFDYTGEENTRKALKEWIKAHHPPGLPKLQTYNEMAKYVNLHDRVVLVSMAASLGWNLRMELETIVEAYARSLQSLDLYSVVFLDPAVAAEGYPTMDSGKPVSFFVYGKTLNISQFEGTGEELMVSVRGGFEKLMSASPVHLAQHSLAPACTDQGALKTYCLVSLNPSKSSLAKLQANLRSLATEFAEEFGSVQEFRVQVVWMYTRLPWWPYPQKDTLLARTSVGPQYRQLSLTTSFFLLDYSGRKMAQLKSFHVDDLYSMIYTEDLKWEKLSLNFFDVVGDSLETVVEEYTRLIQDYPAVWALLAYGFILLYMGVMPEILGEAGRPLVSVLILALSALLVSEKLYAWVLVFGSLVSPF